jgi:HlyD family secretion protein
VLAGSVRRVEPAAFTKVSALGVEEQRVHVLVDPFGPGWDRLGDGFSVEVRIVVAAREDALKIPASALFRAGNRWAAFVVLGGRARLREVTTAEQGDAEVAIVSGLAPGERRCTRRTRSGRRARRGAIAAAAIPRPRAARRSARAC